MTTTVPIEIDSHTAVARKLLAAQGITGSFQLQPLPGGNNNRVFKLSSDNFQALFKSYFQHPDDPRDRCGTEFAFLSFLWKSGLTCIPQPLMVDAQGSGALYEFVEGRSPKETDIGRDTVAQAIAFFTGLNAARSTEAARSLTNASEACFSVTAHLQCTQRRIDALVRASASSVMGAQARDFVNNHLQSTWLDVRTKVETACRALSHAGSEDISFEARRLSPSDFGFHNSIMRPTGQLCFIDFEYAGWDDIAKTICDFFLQPVVLLPKKFYSTVCDGMLVDFANKESEINRIRLLLPVYQIKWCCIMMNEFLPTSEARRKFSLGEANDQKTKQAQLDKAHTLLQQVGHLDPFV